VSVEQEPVAKSTAVFWANDPKWIRPTTHTIVRPPSESTIRPRSERLNERSRELVKDAPSIMQRAKRDFSDMIVEFRESTKEARRRREYDEKKGNVDMHVLFKN
jgi:hypothetical protein